MTSVDNRKQREEKFGDARELTEGVPREGFADATGEYPKRDYYYGTSINKAAKGEQVNNLAAGGGDIDVSTLLEDQRPSEFPHNKVQETTSGHIWEIDDTPGGERVLIKHKTGSGVELRADGSVLITSVNKKVEVSGGDNAVIIEGEADLVYKGNLNIRVSGDYNLDVGGNVNIRSAGNWKERIDGNMDTTIDQNLNNTIRGSRNSQIVGYNNDIVLGSNYNIVKGEHKTIVEGKATIAANEMFQSSQSEWAVSSQSTNITGKNVSVIGQKGTIGGEAVDHYGKLFGGPPSGLGPGGVTFYGSLVGKAQEAITSDFANFAGKAEFARYASDAGKAQSAVSQPGSPPIVRTPKPFPTVQPFNAVPATTVMPNNAIVLPWLTKSEYAIRDVQVDTDLDDENSLISQILKLDDYQGYFNDTPTIHEIRSKFRTLAAYEDQDLQGTLVTEGLISSSSALIIPKATGRAVGDKPSIRFGTERIGNNPADNLSKRFRP